MNQPLAVPVRINTKYLIERFVADVEKASLVPDWTFRETETCGDALQLFSPGNQFPERRTLGAQLKPSQRPFLRGNS